MTKKPRHQTVNYVRERAPTPRVQFLWPAVAIFSVALVVRAIHIWQIRKAPFFSVLMGDSRAYDEWAQQIARGDWLGHDVFYQAPLYPYFLGAIYSVAGRDLTIVRVCQAIVGSLACALLGLAGWRLFSRRSGVIAGLMLALYAPAIFFDGLIQKSVLDLFFLSLALALIGWIVVEPERRSLWRWLGLAIGCLSLVRENALVVAAVIVLWTLVRHPRSRKERAATALLFLIGLGIVLLPVAVRNSIVGGEFHLTTAQFGPNFYIGNNEHADGTYMSLRFGRGAPEHERTDATELAERALGRHLTPAEVSGYWTRRAAAYIASHPVAWVKLLARKATLLWNATEMLDTESQETHAEWSVPLRLAGTVGHFGVLVPLALLGLWVTWPQRTTLWVLYGMIAGYACSVLVFYVFARYRYPLVPFLVLFAGAGVAALPRFLRARSPAHAGAMLAAVGAAAIFTNRPLLSADLMRAITEHNLGSALQERGSLVEAAAHYQRAIELRSDYAPAHNNLGALLRAQGRLDEAIAEYEEALRLYPNYPTAERNLAGALRQRAGGAPERGALQDLRRARQLTPGDASARYDLGCVLMDAGRYAEAIEEFRAALSLTPTPEAHNNLGISLASLGRVDDAIVEFEAALRLRPGFPDAERNLAKARQMRRKGPP